MATFMEAIKQRRSIRKFKAEQIKDEELMAILEAGRLAPSGSNNQTAHFVVVQSAAVLDELRGVVRDAFAAMDAEDDTYGSVRTSIRLSKKGTYNFMYNPPTFVIAANLRGYGNAAADCALALGNMMLRGAELGVGSCWINQLKWLTDHPEVIAYLEKLGIPKDEQVCGCLALGYSDQPELKPVPLKGNRYEIIK